MKIPELCSATLAVVLSGLSVAAPAQELQTHPPKGTFSEAHRFVFFAVLEGCYNDGVTMEEIDLIIPVRPEKEDRRNITQNLVLFCPLCSPAFDAFRLYSDRSIFISEMTDDTIYNTFGQGLDPAVKAELAKPGKPCREAIQRLITRWIDERMQRMRLTEGEEQTLRAQLAEMREEGEEIMRGFQKGSHGEVLQKNYESWDECPVCSGASPMKAAE